MNEKKLYKIIRNIVATTFCIDENQITPQSSSEEIEEWDSLGHIKLILKLESAFHIKLNITVIPKLTNIKAIIEELKQIYGSA